jgi:hypothetical protein
MSVSSYTRGKWGLQTAVGIDILLGLLLLGAGNQSLTRLQLKDGTGLAKAVSAEGVHSPLERAVLPAKEVVAVGAVAGSSPCQPLSF